MLRLGLHSPEDRPLRILCIGAHADDIEIGCGGTMLELLSSERPCSVVWVVFSATDARDTEARASAAQFLERAAQSHVIIHGFRDGYLPYEGAAVKDAFEALKSLIDPDILFTHFRHDLHQDHRLIAELARNTYRDHVILEYEIPKYDGDLRTPNLYVPIGDIAREMKVNLLMSAFGTQRNKRWFAPNTFDGLMRLRGVESASPTGYAEGFHAHKLSIGV